MDPGVGAGGVGGGGDGFNRQILGARFDAIGLISVQWLKVNKVTRKLKFLLYKDEIFLASVFLGVQVSHSTKIISVCQKGLN